MLRISIKNRDFLSAYGGTSSVYSAATAGSALLVNATMVSSTGGDRPIADLGAVGSVNASLTGSPAAAFPLLNGAAAQQTPPAANTVSPVDSSAIFALDAATTPTASSTDGSQPAAKPRTVLPPDPATAIATTSLDPALSDAPTASLVSGVSDTSSAPIMKFSSAASVDATRVDATSEDTSSASTTTATATATTAPLALVTTAAVAAPVNKIAKENEKPGDPISEWGLDGDGGGTIQGFATEISTNIGQTVDFKIATDSTHYRIDIYRLGYYGGDGARKVASIDKSLTTAQIQPHPIVDMSLGLIDCGNWSVSASWEIPADAVSGVYIAKLVREDGTEDASIIPFVVRDDASTSDIVFQTSDTTWQAYNAWGGASLYYGEVPVDPADMIGYLPPNCSCGLTAIGRASAISYNRPIITNTSPTGGTWDYIFGAEHSAIQWLEQNGYDVSYVSGVDAARNGNLLLNHQAYLSVGHDEYWSAEQRANVEAARDSGVNLAFWSGNECYWKVRWESSIDGNGQAYRTMVCYKETWGTSSDPSDIGTGTWRDPRYADPGQQPENALTGTMFTVDSYRTDTISIPFDYSNLRFWRNTDVANLQPGETYNLVQNLLGYEWDSDVENGFRPDGLINLSLSSVAVSTYLRDYGTSIGDAVANHSLTMYRAESGALVFGAGTVFWSWGLNDQHQGTSTPTDPNVQQAMVNMFADMGIQPTTLDASLILATQSTDSVKPTSTITSPIIGASFVEGQHVTITGTAQDFGGGIIAGIEVSTDGGTHWFKATGRENWSYNWVVQASGTYTIMSRAVDDSVNLETPSSGKQVAVTLPDTTGLWTLASKPVLETAIDRDGVELGLRFQSTTGGYIEGIRFYKGFYNVGEHTVSLWDANGTLLATGVSTGESLSGWQTVMFSSPIHISAGTTYVASYHSNGYYSVTENYFTSTYSSGVLKAVDGGSAYAYGATSTFPGNNAGGSNYWVDVVFDAGPNTSPVATGDGGFTISRNGSLTLSFASLVANDTDANGDALTIIGVGNAVNGTVALDTQTGNVIFTPNANYTGPASFSYTLSDGRGGTDQGSVTVSVEEIAAGVSLFQPNEGPTGQAFSDNSAIELGMKFTASSSGSLTGIRFYKAAGSTGTHTGSIWSADGTLLSTVTFTNESLSGWQTAQFSNPLQIQAGVTYVASYHATGTYVATAGYFNSAHTNGALTGLSATASGGNGVYSYGTGTTFPTSSYQASNYWVDVVFNQSTVNSVPVAANDNGFNTYANTALSIASAALLANDNDPDGDPLSITGVANGANGTVTFDSITNTIMFTPTAGYVGAANFSYTIADGRGGTASATVSLTVGPQPTGTGLFSSNDTPTNLAENDPGSVELGVKFVASERGEIAGLRYYKSAQDTGTHVGSLWSSTGVLLASATFTNETASGWQSVTFSQPVSISAGVTYVASYHSNGFYAATPNYFASSHSNGALTAPSSGNGVYAYGTGSLFPTATYNATNYWVDVLYQTATQNAAPLAANDTGISGAANTPLTILASALLANDSDPDGDAISVTGVGNAVNGTVSFDSQSSMITFTPSTGYTGSASFSYTITDAKGATATAQASLAISNQGSEQNVFAAGTTPAIISVNDNSPVNLGMKFQSDAAGWITGIRFYKSEENTGAHTGYLWTASGTLLASATFTNESASGWQSVNLSQQVAIDAGTTYVVSYSTNGNYSATGNFFSDSTTNGNLQAMSSALSGGNGVYGYGSSGLFPTSTYNSTNYYVDVAFKQQLAA
ncbi:Mo-co oxidoreductase dimerization domain-containing protein (plasmid) [Rhizobium favelukesii]|uniref:Mo-co oxidoreductase dimerization domain-containing protein n=2 Tax=Rhizobium/Agrobacterium group TaxID=227290 RepID=W6S5V9_9HYPH|nr:Mo-co oxidoreductase dimerization domain-containing protein [Rhizobium favelukesii]